MRNSVLLLLFLQCCAQEEEILSLQAKRETFEIVVEAQGSLRAVKATTVTAPRARGRNTIAWIVEEGSFVGEGDDLIRFDETALLVKQQDAHDQLSSLTHRRDIDTRSHNQETSKLEGQIYVLQEEHQQAEQFAPRDERIFKRNDIIESEVNLDYLQTKVAHYGRKKERKVKQGTTQQELHELKKQSQELRLKQVHDNMETLVIKAPHEGFFYYLRNWRGEPPKVGEMAWSGMKLGELPDMREMEARVHVLEKEAAGLKVELTATVELDAMPSHFFKAKVKQVATLAKAQERENPIKYFEVVLQIEKTEPKIMRPGSQVHARIFIDKQEQAIALPNQVIFHKQSEHWIYVKQGTRYEKRNVTLGRRGPTRTVIEAGLQAGEYVALSEPGLEAE